MKITKTESRLARLVNELHQLTHQGTATRGDIARWLVSTGLVKVKPAFLSFYEDVNREGR